MATARTSHLQSPRIQRPAKKASSAQWPDCIALNSSVNTTPEDCEHASTQSTWQDTLHEVQKTTHQSPL
ncbi:hypothetical protein CBOM_03318 [Ceraceosorus bombacis]|uniref:Uncharacterized protein n=1 Tax=Ceraceosorus bombacis TaxID=401625 RepID=A0A0P1BKW3_9BASI|nr:hypothetical protein CBOM_03318 [Ceraceosorus bombacis]